MQVKCCFTMSALQASIHCHFFQGQLSAIEYCHVMLVHELSDYVSQLKLSSYYPGQSVAVVCPTNTHTSYPKTTNMTENSKCYWNQEAIIGSKYLSGNNLPLISLIRGKLLPDRRLHHIPTCWFQLHLVLSVVLVGLNNILFKYIDDMFYTFRK